MIYFPKRKQVYVGRAATHNYFHWSINLSIIFLINIFVGLQRFPQVENLLVVVGGAGCDVARHA